MSLILLTIPLAGRSQATPQVSCRQPKFRQFDYWLGRWAVSGPMHRKAADVTVRSIVGGCALEETWTPIGKSGHEGRGISTYNPAIHKWEYFWVAANAYTSFWTGEFHENAMQFATDMPSPSAQAMRHWNMTRMPDGGIQEQALFSQDGGKTWKIQYTLYWKRVQ